MKVSNPAAWLKTHVPRNVPQLQSEAQGVLKLVLWLALLAPVVIVPVYYLLVTFGVLPQIHLPPG
ncbi:MAG: hypothetical protein JRM73_03725 [Nitrososphaerota archaeon]|nr:hypothetical protein [Nitrososphaerota archaeon]